MLFVLNKKKVFISIFIIVILASCFTIGSFFVKRTSAPKYEFTIVIDPGHGGRDNGVIGCNGTYESEINLKISNYLAGYFKGINVNVVLTRTDANGLYDENVKNKKIDDMEKRKKIIKAANPNIVISIHQNGYANSTAKGIMAFYNSNNPESKNLATTLCNKFVNSIPNASTFPHVGDYYILNCSDYISVLVECGFLTNEEEEALLITEEYQKQIAYSIYCGTFHYMLSCGLYNID